jgi:hypothetical protein
MLRFMESSALLSGAALSKLINSSSSDGNLLCVAGNLVEGGRVRDSQ